MVQPAQTQVRCPQCGQPFVTHIEQIIDGGLDLQAKMRLLSGRVNVAACPHCNFTFSLATPLLYHDQHKELLLTYVPMELGLPKNEQERVIGAMTNAVVNSIPQEQRKGYLLMPKTMLTIQGMIETILESDGITREMIEARRAKLNLAETFLQADPEKWPDMVREHDAELDEEFFTLLVASADAALANGRQDVADRVLTLRETLLEHSTTGQAMLDQARRQETVIQEVAKALDALGENASREDLIKMALEFAHDETEERLQALVGMVRPAMDYQFFLLLGHQIEKEKDEAKEFVARTRDRLIALVEEVDQHAEAVVKQAAATLQAIANSDDLDAAIRSRLDMLDDTFMAVLSSKIQNAEETQNHQAAELFKKIFERTMSILQESAPPPIRFINELLRIQDFETAKRTLTERAPEFGEGLLQLMDVLMQELASQQGETPTLTRLARLREVAAGVLGGSAQGPDSENGREPQSSPIILPFSRKRSRSK
jgi:hypothetical protein